MVNPSYIEDLSSWQEEFSYNYPVNVRFSETDAFGHLNNTTAFVYFEQARIQFFKDCGIALEWFAKAGETIPVTADLHCDYLRQVYFDNELNVFVKVAKIGTSSVDLHYMITNGNSEVCMTGRGTIVQVSRKVGKSVPWTELNREYLSKGIM